MHESIKTMENEKCVYRVEGFSCANCAGKFEANVKKLPGVKDAKVNFGASKISVFGEVTVEELEEAGSFENLKVIPEKMNNKRIQQEAPITKTEPFIKKHRNLLTSALFLLFGYFSIIVNSEDNLVTVMLFAASIVIGGYSLFITGFKNLIAFYFDMKTLMTVAIIGAALIGEWAEGAVVVILFAISEALERFSMDKARNSIRSLMKIAPNEALIRRDGKEAVVQVQDIQIGDIMIVKPGQKIAMDGIVIKGNSAVNQAAITGESVPVDKTVKDEVFAGTVNEEGLLEVKVTKLSEDTTLSKIIHLVEEAQAEKAPSQAFVDKFAKYYTPLIIAIAALVAVIPPLLFNGSWETWVYQGLAILVVGCPCALVISTPVAIVTAIGSAAKHGVLVKGGIYLEELGAIQAVAFDKTGTLTKGNPAVTDLIICSKEMGSSEILTNLAALEHRSGHPLAQAIIQKANQNMLEYLTIEVDNFKSLTGKGIQGDIEGVTYIIGKPSLFKELRAGGFEQIEPQIESLEAEGKTVMVMGTASSMLAIIAVADEIRDSAPDVLKKLHQLGIEKTIMLTGDNLLTAKKIAGASGVRQVQAELLPEDKLKYIKQLKSDYGKVAMVGDGVNDAPALAASTVGIAMGGAGTDTALETADVALMADDLNKLPFAVKLSRRALSIIKQNIAFSIGIKILALLLVVPGWLTLWIAIIADMGATLLVTANGLRLLKVKE